MVSHVAVLAEAAEAVDVVDAWSAILTWVGCTFVNVDLAVGAGKAALAHALVGGLIIDTANKLITK